MNPYRILNVRTDATAAEIKHAFLTLSRTLHPDVSGEDSAKDFAELKSAYDILRDPKKRKQWDASGSVDGDNVSITERANSSIVGLILSALENPAINDTSLSIVELVKNMVIREKTEGERQMLEIEKHINTIKKRVVKLKSHQKDGNLLPLIQIATQHRVELLNSEITKIQDALNLKEEILKQLTTLDYEIIVQEVVRSAPYFVFNPGTTTTF